MMSAWYAPLLELLGDRRARRQRHTGARLAEAGDPGGADVAPLVCTTTTNELTLDYFALLKSKLNGPPLEA
jgi:hypothetical protein